MTQEQEDKKEKACVVCGKKMQKGKMSITQWEKVARCSNQCMRGEGNPRWKGDAAGYSTKHMWLRGRYGCPKKCEECGTEVSKKFEWANLSGKYKRDRSDWKRLCIKCHRKLDVATRARGEKMGLAKLTERQVRVIKWCLKLGMAHRKIAKYFPVHFTSIGQINRGIAWRYVDISKPFNPKPQ